MDLDNFFARFLRVPIRELELASGATALIHEGCEFYCVRREPLGEALFLAGERDTGGSAAHGTCRVRR
jgi:hypothetical protein